MQIQSARPGTVLYWFCNDLRLDDNPAFEHALRADPEPCCVFCHDEDLRATDEFGNHRLGIHRAAFLQQCLADLRGALADAGMELVELRGRPASEIGRLLEDLEVGRVVRSRQCGWYERRCWRQLAEVYPGVEFVEVDASTMFDSDQIDAIGPLAGTFSKFRRQAERLTLPEPRDGSLTGSVATSEAPGLRPSGAGNVFTGGERAAMGHLDRYFASAAPGRYKVTRNRLEGWNSSSKFSPWLAAGCVSARRICQRIGGYERACGANESTYWLFFELLWREYFQWYARAHAAKLFRLRGIGGRTPCADFDRRRFEAWCTGQTEWPLVNACMNELNRTGYLSNRGRQIVASALVNELALDWRCGAGYFEQQLIDYDVASNWGNWQYIAGVGADPRGGRRFDIRKQADTHDPDGSYTRRWTDATLQGTGGLRRSARTVDNGGRRGA